MKVFLLSLIILFWMLLLLNSCEYPSYPKEKCCNQQQEQDELNNWKPESDSEHAIKYLLDSSARAMDYWAAAHETNDAGNAYWEHGDKIMARKKYKKADSLWKEFLKYSNQTSKLKK